MQKKILVLVSNPKGTTNLELLPEINKLKEALRRAVNRERFVVEWEVAVRQADLRRHILDVKPQIIHFCGHGTEQGLVLGDDETGQAKIVPNEVLADLLRAFADLVECVVLNACDSEPLADDLVQHLNYVIGMNQEVRDDAAIAFAEGFYDTLGAGEFYERAFEIGKNAVLGKANLRHAPDALGRKATVVGQDGKPVKVQNREHLIPVLKINPNLTPIKPLWLAPEVERQVVRDLLEAIESGFNTIKLFHTDEPIVLKDQYIPVQVTLERRYKHSVETIGGYAESEAELRRIYAMKGSSEEEIQEEIKRQQVDWEEARRQHSRIVVLADPGMGKSTLLRREVVTSVQQAYQALAEGKPVNDIIIPLFIRLSTLADEVEKMPTGEAILKIIQERHSTLLKHHENAEVVTFMNAFLKKQLLNGKALLLLDALDEVPDGKRQKLLEKLNEFAKDNQTNPCPIVGTSRIVGYGGRLVDGAKDVEIVPFTQKQTEEYIEKWFEYAPLRDESVSVRGLIQALRERPQLAGLAQNPLLLSLICSLYQQDYLTLPVRRCQLYEQAVNYMLGQWSTDNERQSANEGWILAKKELLEELAYQFSCESKQLFSFGELRKKLEKYLKSGNASTDLEGVKAADLIKELCERDGILQRWTAEDDRLPIERRRYLFLHRTFQEYLTASYLSRIDADEIEFEKLFWNYDWHETISLMAGLMYEPIDLIQRIINTKDDIFQTQLLLAGRCIAECSELSHPLVDEIMDHIYQFWLTYPDAEFIRSVVVAIGQTDSSIVEEIAQALKDTDSSVKRSAAEALRRIGNDSTVDALISALKDEDSYFRSRVEEALVQIGNDKVVKVLISVINNADSYVRRSAVEVLGKIGSNSAVDILTSVLEDSNSYVRGSAADALGKIGNNSAVDALFRASQDKDGYVRSMAESALIQLSIDNVQATDALVSLLNNEESSVREEAAQILGMIGSSKTINALITLLKDSNVYVKKSAIEALGKIGSNKVVDYLIYALKHGETYIKESAIEALAEIGTEEAINILISALEDGTVRWKVVKSLGKINTNAEAIDALLSVLKDEDWQIRKAAVEALERSGNSRAVDALILSLEDEKVGWYVVEALGRIGSEQAVNALIAVLKNEDSRVRQAAAVTLGQIGSDRAVDALITTLTDEDSSVRHNTTVALGQIGDSKAVDALVTTLSSDNDYTVRTRAAEALGQIHSEKAVDALVTALHDEYDPLVAFAAKALGQIANNRAIDALVAALNDRIIGYAAVVLAQIGNKKAINALVSALNSENSELRWLAASELRLVETLKWKQIDTNEIVNVLILTLQANQSDIRRYSVEILGKIGSEKAIEALVAVLNDVDINVDQKAVEALSKISSPACLDKLLHSINAASIYRSDVFLLARAWAVRFSKAGLPFIPVYVKLISASATVDKAEE